MAVALLGRTGENGPSIAKTSFLFLCAAVANFLAVLLYTLTQPLIAKIYIPDSAFRRVARWRTLNVRVRNLRTFNFCRLSNWRKIFNGQSMVLPAVATAGVYAIYDRMQRL